MDEWLLDVISSGRVGGACEETQTDSGIKQDIISDITHAVVTAL